MLLGTPGPLRIDLERLRPRLDRVDAAAALAEVDPGDPLSFVETLLLDETSLARYAGPGPLNTDDLPRVSFGDRRRVGTNSGIPAAESLMPDLIVHPGSWLVDGAEPIARRVLRRLRPG